MDGILFHAAKNSPEPAFQVLSVQHGVAILQTRRYQKRRTHRKSKTGCLGCKVRRVKCDEGKPSCGRCSRSNVCCAYSGDSSASNSATTASNWSSQQVSSLTSQQQTISTLIVKPSNPLSPSIFPSVLTDPNSISPYGAPRLALLHHFQSLFHQLAILGGPSCSPIISLGLSRPYLLDAILAVSASHLRHSTPNPTPYRIAEHFQQALAIRSFQSALSAPLDQPGADALVLTSVLLNLLSFSVLRREDENPAKSWVFSTEEGRLNWFSLHMGLKPLLYATEAFRQDTILKWMFDASDDQEKNFHGPQEHTLDAVPHSWRMLCGLSHPNPSPSNIFFEPLRILAIVKELPATRETFFLYLGFFGTLETEFRSLLKLNDERALWVMGYWFGLLCRYDLWWMTVQSQRDWNAVRIYLRRRRRMVGRQRERKNSSEEAMWNELLHDLDTVATVPLLPTCPFRATSSK